jgi:multiple sugar transport system permease protein
MLTQTGVTAAPVGWLTTRTTVLPALIAVNVWRMAPFVAVMVLAGLQAIPETVYEAARIDGATFRHEVRYVMLPHLRPVLLAVTLLLMIWGFNGITIIYAMTRGGPANRSLITPIQIFKHAFEFVRFNEAAALSVMLFAFLAVLTAVYLRVSRAREER